MENRAHALAAGFFVLLLGLAAAASLWWFGGSEVATRDLVVVTRGNVTGLNPQAPVRYRGIKVGKVLRIALDPGDPRDILIDIRIDDVVPLTRGSTAKLGYQGVTGLAHVLLEESGKDPAPLAAADGSRPRIVMQSSLFDELGASGGALLKEAREFLARANAMLDPGNRKRLESTLGNVEKTTQHLAVASTRLPEVMATVQQLLSNDNLRRIERALDGTTRAAGSADTAIREGRELIRVLQELTRQIEASVGEQDGQGIAGVAPRINHLAADIANNSRQLERVLRGLEAAPQSVIFGPPAAAPGPGEAGFIAPERTAP